MDQVLHCLLHPSTATAQHRTPEMMNGPLHPLLCVRLLQRFGFAVLSHNEAVESVPPQASQERSCCSAPELRRLSNGVPQKGWVKRHSYPSLASYQDATKTTSVTATVGGQRSWQHIKALERIAERVISPLLPLVGNGTEASPPHSQVRPVLPFIVEWLCVLPTSEKGLPLQLWLPLITALYSQEGLCKGESLPSLARLLPHLTAKLRPFLGHLDDIYHPQSSARVFAAVREDEHDNTALCEAALTSLFRQLLWENRRSSALSKNDESHVSPSSSASVRHDQLADLLIWNDQTPLVGLPCIRQTLYMAVCRQNSVPKGGVSSESTNGAVRVDTGESVMPPPRYISNTAVSITMPFLSCSLIDGLAVLHLTLHISDDDEFRRFFLRVAPLTMPSMRRIQGGNGVLGTDTAVCTSAAAPASLASFFADTVLISLELDSALQSAAPLSSPSPPATVDNAESVCRRTECSLVGQVGSLHILRFIQPLHDYVQLLRDTEARLFQPEQNGCTTTTAFPWSPVRLTFRSLACLLRMIFERLDALKEQSSCRTAAAPVGSVQRRSADADLRPGSYPLLPHKPRIHALKRLCEVLLTHARAVHNSPSAIQVPVRWFIDAELSEQEAVLRRFCGAARALVRVVMDEKKLSIACEGPEGSVLPSPVPQQQSVVSLVHHTSTGAVALSTVPLSSRRQFTDTLRNLAFRVVEPSLAAFYAARHAALLPPPLSFLTFAEVQALRMGEVDALDAYAPVAESLNALFDHIGGAAGITTGRHIVCHPGQHSIATVVEGIRLTALQLLLFGSPSLNTETSQLQLFRDVIHSIFSVVSSLAVNGNVTSDTGANTMSSEQQQSTPSSLQHRLSLLGLILVLHQAKRQHGCSNASGDPVIASFVASFLELLTKGEGGWEWSSLLSPDTVKRCHAPSAGLPIEQWALAEELQYISSMAYKTELTDGDSSTWRWLGSPEALYAALLEQQHSETVAATTLHASVPRARAAPSRPLYLLPWSTIAASCEPLRLYDESRQSCAAAQAWESSLQALLSPSGSFLDDGAASEVPPSRCSLQPIVRLVSVAEELRLFTGLQVGGWKRRLSQTVVVIDKELLKEERIAVVARHRLEMMRHQRSGHAGRQMDSSGASTAQQDGSEWYSEEDYDGLD